LTASGLAFQADGGGGGSNGGTIVLEAALDVTLDDSDNFARGDMGGTGGLGEGGNIKARAFTGALSWKNVPGGLSAIGDVGPGGTGRRMVGRGTTAPKGWGPIPTAGPSFPVVGSSLPPFPATTSGACGGSPSVPLYVSFGNCTCGQESLFGIT